MTRAVALAVALLALMPAGAAARRHHHRPVAHRYTSGIPASTPAPRIVLPQWDPTFNPLQEAMARARTYWGASPSCPVQVVFGIDPNGNGDAVGWATPGTCTLGLVAAQWADVDQQRLYWLRFCLTVVHEWGHLLGHDHSPDPTSPMYPVLSDVQPAPNEPPQCILPERS